MRRTSWLFPAPVGPVISSGERLLIATFSIRDELVECRILRIDSRLQERNTLLLLQRKTSRELVVAR